MGTRREKGLGHDRWVVYLTITSMKMTMHIDAAFHKGVMVATGAANKTHSVDIALQELDRRAPLVRQTREGLGLSPEEMKALVDPTYGLSAMRLKETPVPHGREPGTRR